MGKFSDDKIAGGEVQKEVCAFLNRFYRKEFGKCEEVVGYFPKWDIIAGKGKTFEVKYDRFCHRTRNFFIEIVGFNKSCADYWVLVDSDNYHFIQRGKLENLIGMCELRKMGGDKKAWEGWLIPSCNVKHNSTIYPRTWQKEPEWYQKYIIEQRKAK